MANFYLNAGSITEDGLTPDTGYHSLTALQDNVGLADGDIIKLVLNGEIVEPLLEGLTYINFALSVQSYEGNASLPIWKLPKAQFDEEAVLGSLIFNTSGYVNVNNIYISSDILGISDFGGLGIRSGHLSVNQCFLDNVSVRGHFADSSSSLYVINCIGAGLDSVGESEANTAYVSAFAFNGTYDVKVINNTFYKGSGGVYLFENCNAKIINNIFLNQFNVSIYAEGGLYTQNVNIDYNNTFGWGGSTDILIGVPEHGTTFIGENNKRGVDPILENPNLGLFNPVGISPCFLSAIGSSLDADVPIVDFNDSSRNDASTTIGALNGIPEKITKYWINDMTGFWNDSSNWSDTSDGTGGANIPTYYHDVYFLSPGQSNLDIVPTVKSLTMMDGTLNLNGKSFFVKNDLNVQGNAIFLKSGITGSYVSVGGDATIIGKSGQYMDILADGPWEFVVSGNASAMYVNVANSNANRGSTIDASHSGDGMFNYNWNFHPDLSPNSINYFKLIPVRNGREVISKIVPDVLLTRASTAGGGTYFDDISKIARVDILFRDSNSRETKRIIHVGANLEGFVSWSTLSSPGVWQAFQARLLDNDGAELFIDRSILGSYQDITLV